MATPDCAAPARWWRRRANTPSCSHSVRALGRPLSKTEVSEPLASVATNGVQAMPPSNGSL